MCGMRTSRSTRSGLVLPTSGSTCVPDWVSPTISKSAVGFERPLDPVEDEAMVVGDHHAHGAQCGTGPRRRFAPKRRRPPETEIGAPRRTRRR